MGGLSLEFKVGDSWSSLDLYGSLNAGDDSAAAQTQQGSAPDIAGQDRANPTSLILSTAMLLNWFGECLVRDDLAAAGQAIEQALDIALKHPDKLTKDLGGSLGTRAFAGVVADAISH